MRISVLILALLLAVEAMAQGYVVVVAKDSPVQELSMDMVRDIFLRRRYFENDVRLVPVNLLGEDSARVDFENRVLEMDRSELSRYWTTSHFQGVSPPTTQASLASIKAFVERVDGAISYLPANMVDDSVKVVYEF